MIVTPYTSVMTWELWRLLAFMAVGLNQDSHDRIKNTPEKVIKTSKIPAVYCVFVKGCCFGGCYRLLDSYCSFLLLVSIAVL